VPLVPQCYWRSRSKFMDYAATDVLVKNLGPQGLAHFGKILIEIFKILFANLARFWFGETINECCDGAE